MLDKIVEITRVPITNLETIREYLQRVSASVGIPLDSIIPIIEKGNYGGQISEREQEEYDEAVQRLTKAIEARLAETTNDPNVSTLASDDRHYHPLNIKEEAEKQTDFERRGSLRHWLLYTPQGLGFVIAFLLGGIVLLIMRAYYAPPASVIIPPDQQTSMRSEEDIAAHRTPVVVIEQDFPITMTFDRVGRLFYSTKNGNINVVDVQGDGASYTWYNLPFHGMPVYTQGEYGLLGIEYYRDSSDYEWIYAYYSHAGMGPSTDDLTRQRLIRIRRHDNFLEQLVDNIQSGAINPSHAAGNIHIGPDNKLYVSVGTPHNFLLDAQSLDTNNGKILRLNLDGTPAPENPFPQYPAVWALGFRNPFDFTFHPLTGRLYAVDDGPESPDVDEINLIERGKNYGWPEVMGGVDSLGRFENPIWSFFPIVTPTGPEIISGDRFPELKGMLLICEYNTGRIRRFAIDGSDPRRLEDKGVIAEGCTSDIKEAPDGNIYFTGAEAKYHFSGPGTIYRYDP